MKHKSKTFKRKVAIQYLKGNGTLRSISQSAGVSVEAVRSWAKQHKEGKFAPTPRTKKNVADEKLQIIKTAVVENAGQNELVNFIKNATAQGLTCEIQIAGRTVRVK